jgi:hypothetical protein
VPKRNGDPATTCLLLAGRRSLQQVVSEFVVVDQGEAVDVSMTADEEQGTVFSVAIPVKRVKSESFEGNAAELELVQGGDFD